MVSVISVRIFQSDSLVAENLASALYEVSYLKANDSLHRSARWDREKRIEREREREKQREEEKRTNIINMTQNKLKKTSSTIILNDNKITMTQKTSFLSYNDRIKLQIAMKSAFRNLSICWKVCGNVLNGMKRKKCFLVDDLNQEIISNKMFINNNNDNNNNNNNNNDDNYNNDNNNNNNSNKNNNNNNNNNNKNNNNISNYTMIIR